MRRVRENAAEEKKPFAQTKNDAAAHFCRKKAKRTFRSEIET